MKTYPIVIGVIQFRDKILLLKRSKSKRYSPNLWEFVSGFLKGGESAEEAVLREIKEETNLKVKIIKSGKPFEAKDIWGRWIIIPFLFSVRSGK
jgi:NADH pyrophosphatase NudC (nudix superfamily)